MAKRSPILGYNHNVRYRGLIFHVQTEDSGQQTPHLFTHLFYEGVIISSRKLVYDAGSAEDSIKGLMQSQHKVVMKDLKRGAFDDKIDIYLKGTAGLLPRESVSEDEDAPRPSAPEITIEPARPSAPEITITRPAPEQEGFAAPLDEVSEPPPAAVAARAPSGPQRAQPGPTMSRTQTAERKSPAPSRTQTADRKSAPTKVRSSLSSSPVVIDGLDAATLTDDATAGIAEAVAAANATVKTQIQIVDSGALQLDLEDPDEEVINLSRGRSPRDTQVESLPERSDGVPGSIGGSPSAGVRGPEQRSAVGAASLPPSRPVARPPSRQAMTPPQVVARPVQEDGRARTESDAVEIYAPAPPSADVPPGAAGERPGQYAQHKRVSTRIPVDAIKGERSGSIPIPAGLSRPNSASNPPQPGSGPLARDSAQPPPIPPRTGTPSAPARAPGLGSRPTERPRTPTPARVSASTPSASRAPSANSSGGVVMTRPAVIVGAPPKPTTMPPRVRKAREEEGRGFGQGLISEKSLDEVILAYLSEDADEK